MEDADHMFPKLTDLPDEIILLIFQFCDVSSLGRLAGVCRRFSELLSDDEAWLSFSKQLTIINVKANSATDSLSYQKSARFRSRIIGLSLKEHCRIAKNWSEGVYRSTTLIRYHERQMPCMQRVGKYLWVSSSNTVKKYRVFSSGRLHDNIVQTLCPVSADVNKFVCRDDRIVAVYQDGSVCGWLEEGSVDWFKYSAFLGNPQCVDYRDNVVAVGSRHSALKVVNVSSDVAHSNPVVMPTGDRVWSLTLSQDAGLLVSGTAGCHGSSPLSIWDVSTCLHMAYLEASFKFGAGVLDVRFISNQELLSAGYDTKLRLWDLRTLRCEREWEEPFDSTVYCFQSDGDNVMVTGTAHHGMTRLWDKRHTLPIQMYYAGERSSPVYALTFDHKHLIVALDYSVNLLDFSAHIRNRSW